MFCLLFLWESTKYPRTRPSSLWKPLYRGVQFSGDKGYLGFDIRRCNLTLYYKSTWWLTHIDTDILNVFSREKNIQIFTLLPASELLITCFWHWLNMNISEKETQEAELLKTTGGWKGSEGLFICRQESLWLCENTTKLPVVHDMVAVNSV